MLNLDDWYKYDQGVDPKTDMHYEELVHFLETENTEKSKKLLSEVKNCKDRKEFRILYRKLHYRSILNVF